MSIATGQAGSVGDEWVRGIDGIWATGRRWERSQTRTGQYQGVRSGLVKVGEKTEYGMDLAT